VAATEELRDAVKRGRSNRDDPGAKSAGYRAGLAGSRFLDRCGWQLKRSVKIEQ
jgi:hypothetical protein